MKKERKEIENEVKAVENISPVAENWYIEEELEAEGEAVPVRKASKRGNLLNDINRKYDEFVKSQGS